MQAVKILLGILAIILAGPVIFGLYYSVQAGCFFCFEGDMAGSDAETWLNIGLLALVVCFVTAALWRWLSKRRVND